MTKLDELIPDTFNTNQHTERGRALTSKSVDQFGPRKPLELDKNNVIIDGNQRSELLAERDVDEVRVIDVQPGEVVAVRYVDADLMDKGNWARAYQIAQAKAGKESLDFDPEMMLLHAESVDMEEWFRDWEMNWKEREGNDIEELWQGMPEFNQENQLEIALSLKVNFKTESDVKRFSELIGQNITLKTKSIWYPEVPKMNLTEFKAIDES